MSESCKVCGQPATVKCFAETGHIVPRCNTHSIVSSDPVHQDLEGTSPDQWYFWDETWADRYGPYPNEDHARQKLREYCKFLDEGIPFNPHSALPEQTPKKEKKR